MPPFRRVGRPGLLGLAARTAVVAGTASVTAGAVQRHQSARQQESFEAQQLEAARQQEAMEAAARAAVQQQAPTPAPAPAAGGDLLAELERLGQLRTQGLLDDEEFANAKAAIIARST